MELDENIKSNDLNKKVSHQDNIIKKLNSQLKEKNIILSQTKSYLFDLEYDLNSKNNIINEKDEILRKNNKKIEEITINFNKEKEDLIRKNNTEKEEIIEKNNKKLEEITRSFNKEKADLTRKYNSQISKLQSKDYCISCLERDLDNKNYEIDYLKNSFIKKILYPVSLIYLLFKSKPKDLKINFNLLKAFKNYQCFDIGYYLNNNSEVKNSFICRYFSAEIHYLIYGFEKDYEFNKRYFNRKSKQDLLNYISNQI